MYAGGERDGAGVGRPIVKASSAAPHRNALLAECGAGGVRSSGTVVPMQTGDAHARECLAATLPRSQPSLRILLCDSELAFAHIAGPSRITRAHAQVEHQRAAHRFWIPLRLSHKPWPCRILCDSHKRAPRRRIKSVESSAQWPLHGRTRRLLKEPNRAFVDFVQGRWFVRQPPLEASVRPRFGSRSPGRQSKSPAVAEPSSCLPC